MCPCLEWLKEEQPIVCLELLKLSLSKSSHVIGSVQTAEQITKIDFLFVTATPISFKPSFFFAYFEPFAKFLTATFGTGYTTPWS